MTYVLMFKVPIYVAISDDTAAVRGTGQYMMLDDMLSALQRQHALRRKVQQGDEEDAATGGQASAGAPQQETTAPSDLRFDVPTGGARLQLVSTCRPPSESLALSPRSPSSASFSVRGRLAGTLTPRLRLRSVPAEADPSADELRQKLHERIEVLTLLSFPHHADASNF